MSQENVDAVRQVIAAFNRGGDAELAEELVDNRAVAGGG
jgi:hypothetical protein